MAGGKEENNAFFYSLVSTDTQVTSAGDDAVCMEILKDDADGMALHKARLKGSMSARTTFGYNHKVISTLTELACISKVNDRKLR
nr:hypothetical protein [Tanacetum cinerariifolium]